MSQVLGRVTQATPDEDRGPDVIHKLRIPAEWLERGETIELEVPRHLSCAGCDGGGCDRCERSGAITMRGREEPPELVRVTLPERTDRQSLTLRIPDHGGFAEAQGAPRGLLLLSLVAAGDTQEPSKSVWVYRPNLTLAPEASGAPKDLVRRSAWLALLLVLAFLLMLYLGGWL